MSNAAYSTQLLYQIRVLLRYIAASAKPQLSLSRLVIEDANLPRPRMSAGDIIVSLDAIEAKLTSTPPATLVSQELVLLQLARDKLSEIVAPATGLTVAYTVMVTETSLLYRKGTVNLARNAYPQLPGRAFIHRWSRNVFVTLALLLTVATVWLSTEVAVGKHLLQNMDALRIRQASVAAEEKQLEATLDKPTDAMIPLTSVIDRTTQTINPAALGICERWRAYAEYAHANGIDIGNAVGGQVGDGGSIGEVRLDGSPSARFLCGQDNVLKHDFEIAHDDINRWLTDWPSIVGGVFLVPEYLQSWFRISGSGIPDLPRNDNTELHVAPRILALGNYLLPVCFGMLGSLIYVLLEFWSKAKGSQLEPRDSWLGWIRLVLGLVVGTCIGLFFTAYGPIETHAASAAAGSDLISSLTLSASGLAFLAGFGVEGVFNMLQELVQRVFPAKADR